MTAEPIKLRTGPLGRETEADRITRLQGELNESTTRQTEALGEALRALVELAATCTHPAFKPGVSELARRVGEQARKDALALQAIAERNQ